MARGASRLLWRFQLHSGDPTRPVRELGLTALAARALVLALAFVTLPALLGFALAPWWLYSGLSGRSFRVETVRRAQQGERLQALTGEIEALDRRFGELDSRLTRLLFVYELPLPEVRTGASLAAEPSGESLFAASARRTSALLAAMAARSEAHREALGALEAYERRDPEAALIAPVAEPIRGAETVLVEVFGSARDPYTQEIGQHTALDFAAPRGTPVRATAAGNVAWAGTFDRRWGNWWRLGKTVVVNHAGRYLTIFGHLDELKVRLGARLVAGEVLGTVGRSGWTTRAQLHYEIRRRSASSLWEAVDPRLFLLGAPGAEEGGPIGDGEALRDLLERAVAAGEPLPRAIMPRP